MIVVYLLAFVVTLAVAAAVAWLLVMLARTRAIAREAERLVPATGETIELDGHRIHYVEAGQGPQILLIHGLGGHHHHMRPILEAFGGGYRLISLDRAGSGWSIRAPGADARLTEQARLIVRFIDALGLERPLLVGHSLGGAIALAVALDFPDRISGLALIAPLTHSYDQVPPEFRPLYIPSPLMRRLVAHTVAVPASLRNAPKTLAFVFGPQEPPADYAVAGGGMLGLRPSHFLATATDLVAVGHDLPLLQARYGELDMPVGILFGSKDRVLDHVRHGLAMADKVRDLDLEILEGVGHMPQYSHRERVVAFVRRIADKAFGTEKATARA